MTKRTKNCSWVLSASAAAVVSLAACAGTGDAPGATAAPKSGGADKFMGDARLGEELQQICPVRAISGFSENSSDTVVISMNKESYLIEMRRACYALRDAMGVVPTSDSTCLRSGDRLLVTDSIMPGGSSQQMGTDRCVINRIFRWTPTEPVATPKAKGA